MIYSNTILIYLFLIFISKGDIYFMNKDNEIHKYDKQIVIENISILMKDKGVTQAELAKGIGVSQSRISDCLSGKRDFTLSQFADIANFFETSTDKLLGFTPATTKADEATLADVLQKLFDINQLININMERIDIIDQNALPFDAVPETYLALYFKNDALEKNLEEWTAVDSITTQDAEMKKKLLRLWKEEALSTAKARKAKWNFRNEEEEGKRLYEEIMSQFDERMKQLARGTSENLIYPFFTTKDELELAEKYVQKNALLLPDEAFDALAFAEKHSICLQSSK